MFDFGDVAITSSLFGIVGIWFPRDFEVMVRVP